MGEKRGAPVNTTDLTVSLIRQRMTRAALSGGFSTGEASLMAEQRLKNGGLLGFLRKVKAAAQPEGAIVVIVESFWRSVIQQTLTNPAVTKLDDNDPLKLNMMQQFRSNALGRIEDHRKRFYGGRSDYPKELTEYVIYRLDTEIRHMHRMSSEQMGLDVEVIAHMVEECNDYFRARIDELR